MNSDDEWYACCDGEAAKAVAQWLKGTINIKRSIESLSPKEMKTMVRVAVDTWVALQSRRSEYQRPYQKPDDRYEVIPASSEEIVEEIRRG